MLGLIFAIYVGGAVVFFFAFAAYYWSHGQSVGQLWLTMLFWPILLPLMLMWYLFGVLLELSKGKRAGPLEVDAEEITQFDIDLADEYADMEHHTSTPEERDERRERIEREVNK